ncbi:unnamed protein product [Ostreobium quekettii]|uniref:GYF domain-containing protein n=1 Tax=Ostreobium quekettii TaxID=121088 RepID=A0A8S1ISN4_9CHLO|nr:unnamed protein product [Ostreobium quekettii]
MAAPAPKLYVPRDEARLLFKRFGRPPVLSPGAEGPAGTRLVIYAKARLHSDTREGFQVDITGTVVQAAAAFLSCLEQLGHGRIEKSAEVWRYIDDSGNMQGPFSHESLESWKKYLSAGRWIEHQPSGVWATLDMVVPILGEDVSALLHNERRQAHGSAGIANDDQCRIANGTGVFVHMAGGEVGCTQVHGSNGNAGDGQRASANGTGVFVHMDGGEVDHTRVHGSSGSAGEERQASVSGNGMIVPAQGREEGQNAPSIHGGRNGDQNGSQSSTEQLDIGTGRWQNFRQAAQAAQAETASRGDDDAYVPQEIRFGRGSDARVGLQSQYYCQFGDASDYFVNHGRPCGWIGQGSGSGPGQHNQYGNGYDQHSNGYVQQRQGQKSQRPGDAQQKRQGGRSAAQASQRQGARAPRGAASAPSSSTASGSAVGGSTGVSQQQGHANTDTLRAALLWLRDLVKTQPPVHLGATKIMLYVMGQSKVIVERAEACAHELASMTKRADLLKRLSREVGNIADKLEEAGRAQGGRASKEVAKQLIGLVTVLVTTFAVDAQKFSYRATSSGELAEDFREYLSNMGRNGNLQRTAEELQGYRTRLLAMATMGTG